MAGNLGATAADYITEALSILGVYAQGENISAADLSSSLFTFNAMVDGWGAETLTVYAITPQTFMTQANKQTYSLGPDVSNDFIATLPVSIEQASMLLGTTELPLTPRTQPEWAALSGKSITGSVLSDLYVAYGAAAHQLNFWPVPSQTIAVVLYMAAALAQIALPSNVISVPPGYKEALIFELAIKLASKFGAKLPAYLPSAWDEAKTKIKARNYTPEEAPLDPALSRGRGLTSWRLFNFGR
jgi:hypothetical protein